MLIAALTVAISAVVAALVVAAIYRSGGPPAGPVAVAAVPAPWSDSSDCQALLAALPETLGDYRRAELAAPAPQGAAAFTADGSDAVVLRCGLDRPVDFVVGSPIQVVDHVQWFEVDEDDRATWYAVDREVYVALTLPRGSGPTPIQELSELIEHTMGVAPIRPAPPR